jgi:hypothetical protein
LKFDLLLLDTRKKKQIIMQNSLIKQSFQISSTVKPVYNDHLQDSKIVVIVDRWSLFRGSFML